MPDSTTQSGPVGQGEYVVQRGECIHSIAFDHGHFWETLWNHADNEKVKTARSAPNLLLEGDRLTVPPIQTSHESCATDARHTFRRKGVPGKLILQIMKWEDEDAEAPLPTQSGDLTDEGPEDLPPKQVPDANVPWKCEIDGVLSNGTTDSEGRLELQISPGARNGVLTLESGTPRERRIDLRLGGLDPIDSDNGVRQRLRNLSFCGPSEREESLRQAIEAFQRTHDLNVTGEADDEFVSKLKDVHGS